MNLDSLCIYQVHAYKNASRVRAVSWATEGFAVLPGPGVF